MENQQLYNIFNDALAPVVASWPAERIGQLLAIAHQTEDDITWLSLRDDMRQMIKDRSNKVFVEKHMNYLVQEDTDALKRHLESSAYDSDLYEFIEGLLRCRDGIKKVRKAMLDPGFDVEAFTFGPRVAFDRMHTSLRERISQFKEAVVHGQELPVGVYGSDGEKNNKMDRAVLAHLYARRIYSMRGNALERAKYSLDVLRSNEGDDIHVMPIVADTILSKVEWKLPCNEDVVVDKDHLRTWLATVEDIDALVPGAFKVMVTDLIEAADVEVRTRPTHVPTAYIPEGFVFKGTADMLPLGSTAREVNNLVARLYLWSTCLPRFEELSMLVNTMDKRLGHIIRAVTDFRTQVFPDDVITLRALPALLCPLTASAVAACVPNVRKRRNKNAAYWADNDIAVRPRVQ